MGDDWRADRKPMPIPFDISWLGDGEVFVTADYHLGNEGILTNTRRGEHWKTIKRHDNAMIRNTCEVVSEKDLLIIVGDFTMFGPERAPFIERAIAALPGRKILVYGNHDRIKPMTLIDWGFTMATTSMVIGDALLIHDPVPGRAVWPHDKPVVCGHVHEWWRVLDNVVNVGLDMWDYKPVRLREALAAIVF